MDRGFHQNHDRQRAPTYSARRFVHQVENCAITGYHIKIQIRWSQEEIGVPLGTLTEGSIEKTNQDVKQANSRFVPRYSMENIHKNTLSRLSWEADPVLHYEGTVNQVIF